MINLYKDRSTLRFTPSQANRGVATGEGVIRGPNSALTTDAAGKTTHQVFEYDYFNDMVHFEHPRGV